MASSREAFRRFEMWKNLQTSLNLVDIDPSGGEKRRSGEICQVDEANLTVVFIEPSTRDFFPLEFDKASFFVDERSVEVLRADRGCRIFTEE